MFQNYQEKVNNVGGDANDAEVVQDGVQDECQVDGDEWRQEEGEDLKWRNESAERKNSMTSLFKF